MPSKEIGDKIGACFEKAGLPQGAPGQGGSMPPGQTGPGGCASPEECKTYCESHQDECQKFQPGTGAINPGEQTMPEQSGPGGCKTPEECQTYCSANPDACRNFSSPGAGPQGQPPLPSQPPLSGSQSQLPPQGQYGYPVPGQIQPPLQSPPPLPSQPPLSGSQIQPPPQGQYGYPAPGQPQEGNIPMSPPSLNPSEPPPQLPTNMQPPPNQQPPMQPSPGNLPPPSSFNVFNLLSAVGKTFSSFLNSLNRR